MYFIFTAEKPDGELHVRHGEGLQRGHVLPQTGTQAPPPPSYSHKVTGLHNLPTELLKATGPRYVLQTQQTQSLRTGTE